MMDKGKKYLLIKYSHGEFIDDKESDWSLVENNEDFAYTNWFCYEDYEVYKPYEIKKKFMKNNTKLSEKKLKSNGYIKIIGKTYDWAYTWFFDILGIESLKEYFLEIEDKEKTFWDFVDAVDIREEVYLIEDWLRLFLAEKWCKSNKIDYKVEVPDDYPRKLSEAEIRKGIKKKIENIKFDSPFEFLNEIHS